MLDDKLLTFLISLIVSIIVSSITLLIGWIKWRKEYKLKLKKFREDVNKEAIKLRFEPYSELIKSLQVFSNFGNMDKDAIKKVVSDNRQYLHDSFFNKAGLLSSHETRQLMLYVLKGFGEYLDDKISPLQLKLRLWSLHFSLRSDLGIMQPDWEDTIDKLNKNKNNYLDRKSIQQLVESYPWHKYDYGTPNINEEDLTS